jgi:tetratricopeptide (TPR) repeat protein
MPEARLRLADTLRASSQLGAAVAQYEEAVRLDPGLLPAWTGAIESLIALGNATEARIWLERAQRVHPSHAALATLAAQLK